VKKLGGLTAVVLLALAFGGMAMAQGMPNNEAWGAFLAAHPQTAAELNANPNLMYNPSWQAAHPNFQEWAKYHYADWQALKAQRGMFHPGGLGAWDQHGVWRDQGWWRANNPNWVAAHHPEWGGPGPMAAAVPPRGWGAYDEHHVWRDQHWWMAHHPDWVQAHHAEWLAHH